MADKFKEEVFSRNLIEIYNTIKTMNFSNRKQLKEILKD